MLMLAAHLEPERWRTTMLVDDDPGAEAVARLAAEAGLPVRRLPPTPQGLAGAWSARHLARLLHRERPDVFHAHLSWPVAAKWPLAAAVATRVPAVATVQLVPEFDLDRSSFLQLRLLSRVVGRYIAVSQAVADELIGRFRWPAEKVSVVYNAVELDRYGGQGSPALRKELGADGRLLVLTSARLDEQKGHRVLLRAATEVPGASFAFAGEGPERTELEALAHELGVADRVRFLGHRTDIAELLAACDVFVLPSLYEGSSLAVLEAMAARRPVLSSAIGGTDELIEDGRDGLLVPPGDAEALAAAMRRLLGDAELREGIATRGREKVERRFSPQALAGGVESAYGELLGDARARG